MTSASRPGHLRRDRRLDEVAPQGGSVARTLITGMSGTGKSSTIRRMVTLGHHAVDLDAEEWSHLVPDDSRYADPDADRPLDWRWREDEVAAAVLEHAVGA